MMYDNLTIAIIGDIMLDHWREGTEYKLNPESPTIDIINPTSEYTLGGAGNVARIIAGLGASPYLLGMLGSLSDYGSVGTLSDLANDRFANLCIQQDISNFVVFEDRKTTVKERIVCNGQQICRISKEDVSYISVDAVAKLGDELNRMAKDLDGIIVADYSKGVMRDMLIHAVMHIAKENDIPVLVDPKDRLYIYKGCTIMKPNQKEYDSAVPDLHVNAAIARQRFGCEHLVITSECGMQWWSEGKSDVLQIEEGNQIFAHKVEVVNVSGAGDAVAAVLLVEYIRNGGDIRGAVELANWGASKVVQQERTGHLAISDLEEFINERGEATKSNLSGQRWSD